MLCLFLALTVTFLPVSGLSAGAKRKSAPAAEKIPADWLAAVETTLRRAEYSITWQDQPCLPDLRASYQAPNRAQNLRIYFSTAGPVVIPRDHVPGNGAPAWRWELALRDWGRGSHRQAIDPPVLQVADNRIEYRRGKIVEWYQNDEKGLEQGFTITAPPFKKETGVPLRIGLSVTGTLEAAKGPSSGGLEFRDAAGLCRIRYDRLLAFDAAGQTLATRMDREEGRVVISVDDSRAVYPVTIDPTVTGLPAAYDWLYNPTANNALFGRAVATAGDVNGDGISDVIVGAPDYDGGEALEGAVFVLLGSASGLQVAYHRKLERNQAGARFGYAVSTAGDFDGDGFSDVIVGAPNYDHGNNNEGAAWLYYGGWGGLGTTAALVGEGGQDFAWFGSAVGTVGDVNGDGFADVVVGAYGYSGGSIREGKVFVWHGSPTGISSGADWTAEVDKAEAYFGRSVGTAGDVNGDGFSDLVVGADGYDGGAGIDEGALFVWHGSAAGLNNGSNGTAANAAWFKRSNQAGAVFGWSAATAGDVNGDGYADIIVGAPLYTRDFDDEGMVWVYHGSAAGLISAPAWSKSAGQAGAHFGHSVFTAGDVNGDGYADVIAGAPYYDGKGGAWVYVGTAAGLRSAPVWHGEVFQTGAEYGYTVSTAGDVNGDGFSDVIVGAPQHGHASWEKPGFAFAYYGAAGGPAAAAGWSQEGDEAGGRFGCSVAGAGDVNGDGYADVIVGARDYDNGLYGRGAAWVYLGSPEGPDLTPHWWAFGATVNQRLGWSVAGAGDVNGDGYADVIIGSPHDSDGLTREGSAEIYLGSATGLAATWVWKKFSGVEEANFGQSVAGAGDVNGDGYADIIVGAPDSNNERGEVRLFLGSAAGPGLTPAWQHAGNEDHDRFGYSVASAGDVNGDGLSDIIIGAPLATRGQDLEGGAYVYLGRCGGLGSAPAWTKYSDDANARFGSSVAGAGDVNGDGYADIIVGAPVYLGQGYVFVYHGSAAGVSAAPNWSKPGSQAGSNFGAAVAGAGDLNGDGFADVIAGAPNYGDEGYAFAYQGSPAGLNPVPVWHGRGSALGELYGTSVASAGDVNGDGYADLLVGAPFYIDTPEAGKAYLYYGNGGPGRVLQLRQANATNGRTIAPLGRAAETNRFAVKIRLSSPFGRGPVKVETEVKPLGHLFNQTQTILPEWWANALPAPGVATFGVDGLTACTPYHWRVRFHYHPAAQPYQPRGPWLQIPWNGWNEPDLRTSCLELFLPLILKQ
jgi:hypothetical protein